MQKCVSGLRRFWLAMSAERRYFTRFVIEAAIVPNEANEVA